VNTGNEPKDKKNRAFFAAKALIFSIVSRKLFKAHFRQQGKSFPNRQFAKKDRSLPIPKTSGFDATGAKKDPRGLGTGA